MNTDEIIEQFTELRKKKKISQIQLEKLSGIKQPVIARAERRTTDPRLSTIVKLLDALGYTLHIVPKKKLKICKKVLDIL